MFIAIELYGGIDSHGEGQQLVLLSCLLSILWLMAKARLSCRVQ